MVNEISILRGIAIATNNAFLNPKKNSRTKSTKTNPEKILFSRFFTLCLMSFDWSTVKLK